MTMEKFKDEAEMCDAFMGALPPEWVAYPETGGFDILLVRKADGFQIGIEAKLLLNAKVIGQTADNYGSLSSRCPGPDCYAVLVPDYAAGTLSSLCRLLGIEVLRIAKKQEYWRSRRFYPELPKLSAYRAERGDEWFEFCPDERIKLPEVIPDTRAGCPSPVTLTPWKIAAIKLMIILEKNGSLTRADFDNYGVSMSRWIVGGMSAWLIAKERGIYTDNNTPDFRAQHPKNYAELEATFDKWQVKPKGKKK